MKISIIVPFFNLERHISRVIESLVLQTSNNFEVLFIDDGSTDSTYHIILNAIKKNPDLNFRVIQKKNGGVSSARNYGLNNCTGDFVLFLDGDDYVSPYLVECIEKTTKSKNLDIVYWNFEYVSDMTPKQNKYLNIDSVKITKDTSSKILKNFLVSETLSLWTASIVYNREFLIQNELCFKLGCSNGEDQEFIIKAFLNAKNICFIDEVLSFYVQRQGSISNSYNINRFDAINALKRSKENLIKNNEAIKMDFSSFVQNKIFETFLAIYNSSILYLIFEKKMSIHESLNQLNFDLENNYPGLKSNIFLDYKNQKILNKIIYLKLTFLFYYPSMYYRISSYFKKGAY